MSATRYSFTTNREDKTIERIVSDDQVMINHVILPAGNTLPRHRTDANVYLILVAGRIRVKLEPDNITTYNSGDIIAIPHETEMEIEQDGSNTAAFFIIKSPNPNM